MKILLITFSGTGNTTLCGEYIKKHLESYKHEVTHYVYNKDLPFNENPNDFDMVGLGYPIHAFNAPQVFVNLIKNLPICNKNIPYFIYKVSGEPFKANDASSIKIYRILKKKGYFLIAEKHFLMPYNIIFRYKDSLVKQMSLYLSPLCLAFVKGILLNQGEKIKYRLWEKTISFLFRIEWLAPKVNVLFLHSKKNKCIKCNKCVDNCPTKSLFYNKKGIIKSKTSCALCMRCSYNCPVDALNMGLVNLWRVNPPYKYDQILDDDSIKDNYVNAKTKGYFKAFKKYFYKQNILLKKYNIEIPVNYENGYELETLFTK